MIAMAFPIEFPFGLTSFRTPRHAPTEDLIDWPRHLGYLCYKLDDETGKLEHTFQKNPAFVLYIRNRAHRHAINNDINFYSTVSPVMDLTRCVLGGSANLTRRFATP